MTERIRVETQIIEGFEVYKAGSDLYEAVAGSAAQEFGEKSKAYATIMKGIKAQDATGSQFFFNTRMNERLPDGQRVATFDDLQTIHDGLYGRGFFRGIYVSNAELILRSAVPSQEKHAHMLEHLVGQVREKPEWKDFAPDNPLVMSGVRLVEDTKNEDNEHGLLFDAGNAKAVYRPEFAHTNNKVRFGRTSERHIRADEHGLSGVYLDRSGIFFLEGGALFSSGAGGRIIVFVPQTTT